MTRIQLAFDLGHAPALGRDDFLVAPCNSEAVAWLERWPDWPGHALALHGPAGCGKTHLLSAFAQHHGAKDLNGGMALIPASLLSAAEVPDLVAGTQAVLVDDLDDLGDEAALFHLWNLTKETGRFLLMAGRVPPARLKVDLPDLRSRLAASAAVGIGAPDDALLQCVLVKQLADRQLRVGEEVVAYVLGRMERSFAAARRLVEELDAASLAERRPITVALARSVLERLAAKDERQGEFWE